MLAACFFGFGGVSCVWRSCSQWDHRRLVLFFCLSTFSFVLLATTALDIAALCGAVVIMIEVGQLQKVNLMTAEKSLL